MVSCVLFLFQNMIAKFQNMLFVVSALYTYNPVLKDIYLFTFGLFHFRNINS